MIHRLAKLLPVAVLLAFGCATPTGGEHGRLGAVAPGQFRTIPAAYDPSVTGYPGAVGDIVQNAGSATAWVRSGTGNTDWQAFPSSGSAIPSQTQLNIASLTPATRTAAVSIKAGARLLWAGDSITKGYNGSDNPLYRWQLLLEQWITSEFASAGLTPPTIISTTAVSGQTSLDLLNGVAAQVTSQTPDVVIVNIGTNDTVRSTGGGGGSPLTPAQTQANISGIIAAGLASNAAMKFIIVSPLFQTGENWPRGSNVTNGGDAAMDGVRSAEQAACTAAGTSVCQYIDMSQYAFAWEATNNLTHASSGLLTQEGTHPTHPLAQQIWGAAVFQQLSLATQKQLAPVIPPLSACRTLTASSGQASLDFQNLAGGVDGGYRIVVEWQAGTGGDDDMILQINGVTTSYTTSVFGQQGGGTSGFWSQTGDFGGGANTAGVGIGRAGGAAGRSLLKGAAEIADVDGTAAFYFVRSDFEAANATGGTAFQGFKDSASVPSGSNPITRITLTTKSGGSTKIGTGSRATLCRVGFVQ